MNTTPGQSPTPGITGIVGPNGAGKTHYLRELAQDLRSAMGQAAGDMHYFGRNPKQHFRTISAGWRELDVKAAADWIGFSATTPWRKLSLGQRQKVINAGVVFSGKSTLLLDEPFNGLDSAHRKQLTSTLSELSLENPDMSILVTSQHAGDLEGLIERLITVHQHEVSDPLDLDTARLQHPVITGEQSCIAEFTQGYPVLHKSSLGATTRAVLGMALTAEATQAAQETGMEISYLSHGELIELLSEHATSAQHQGENS